MFASRLRQNQETDVEIDMVPIMNMFLVLIPFLLISSSFLHLKAINTSIPTQGASTVAAEEKKSEVKLTLLVSLEENQIDVTVSADELTEKQKTSLAFNIPNLNDRSHDFMAFTSQIQRLKRAFPLSDTILLTPSDTVPYDAIVNAMDAGRGTKSQSLFPHVVLSGILK